MQKKSSFCYSMKVFERGRDRGTINLLHFLLLSMNGFVEEKRRKLKMKKKIVKRRKEWGRPITLMMITTMMIGHQGMIIPSDSSRHPKRVWVHTCIQNVFMNMGGKNMQVREEEKGQRESFSSYDDDDVTTIMIMRQGSWNEDFCPSNIRLFTFDRERVLSWKGIFSSEIFFSKKVREKKVNSYSIKYQSSQVHVSRDFSGGFLFLSLSLSMSSSHSFSFSLCLCLRLSKEVSCSSSLTRNGQQEDCFPPS